MAAPTLPSVSVTFAVIVCAPSDNDVIVKDAVSFAIEPSILEYQSRLEARPVSSVSVTVPVNVIEVPTVA